MSRYVLKKDLPFAKAGTPVKVNPCKYCFVECDVEMYSDSNGNKTISSDPCIGKFEDLIDNWIEEEDDKTKKFRKLAELLIKYLETEY